jgi:hypothetical protein
MVLLFGLSSRYMHLIIYCAGVIVIEELNIYIYIWGLGYSEYNSIRMHLFASVYQVLFNLITY